ncbi:hypothetical protein BECAL_03375 [Bellilinea caldifistulae]|nr:hypothetical protein BECAL_03375 [Bellilinea caldifistulae]
MVTLPPFLPVAEAARKYGLDEARPVKSKDNVTEGG